MGAHPPTHPSRPITRSLCGFHPRSDIPFRCTRTVVHSGGPTASDYSPTMAATSTAQTEFPCSRDGCSNTRTQDSSVEGSYCSQDCHDRASGGKLLERLGDDHRFCASCYRPLKVVYRPADSECPKLRTKALVVRESFVGYEELTEHAEQGAYGIECSCGSVGYGDPESLCRDGSPYEWFLKRAIGQLRREGAWGHRFDVATFADAMWEGDDLDLAVGKAIR